ncbi:aspartate 1-decarboxylase [candidate division KSB1 bacterium]|nr:aspartate 1-decarboxylase [candidate division KSB1 bacterium]
MLLEVLRSKISHAIVTQAELNYMGSITIDENLMDAVGLYENEKVHVLNLANGSRAETYVIKGERGKGDIVMNGAIARMAQIGDQVIILSYGFIDEKQVKNNKPKIIIVDEHNRVSSKH